MYPLSIDLDLCSRLYGLLQQISGIYVSDEGGCHCFIAAVLWITRSGSSWRLLPEVYGNWNSIYKRFNNWSKRGGWQQVFELFKDDPDLENLLIDSTLVCAHPCASGAKGEQALGRSCGVYSTKNHATSDGLGNPLDLAITGGNCHDMVGAKLLLSEQKGERIIADRGYDANWVLLWVERMGMEIVIPAKKNAKSKEVMTNIYIKRGI